MFGLYFHWLALPLTILTLALLLAFTFSLSDTYSDYKPFTKLFVLVSVIAIVELQPSGLWVLEFIEMFVLWSFLRKQYLPSK